MNKITESAIETFAIELFELLGYQYVYGPDVASDSETPERERFEDVLFSDNYFSPFTDCAATVKTPR